jgi:hypothetical protein
METYTKSLLTQFNLMQNINDFKDGNIDEEFVMDCNYCQNCAECYKLQNDAIKGFLQK